MGRMRFSVTGAALTLTLSLVAVEARAITLPDSSSCNSEDTCLQITNTHSEGYAAIYGAGPSIGVVGTGYYGVNGYGTVGVYGSSSSGKGVQGTSYSGAGVYGSSSSSHGVHGYSNHWSTIGVYGESGYSIGGTGVKGYSSHGKGVWGDSGLSIGVQGSSSNSYGVQGSSSTSYGVYGSSTSSHAVYGTTGNSGAYAAVYGNQTSDGPGVQGNSAGGAGVSGYSSSGNGVQGGTGNSNAWAGYFNGKVYATGGYWPQSDARLKKDVVGLAYGLKELAALRPVTFKWKDQSLGDARHVGFLAQDLQKVVPEVVGKDGASGTLSVNYDGLIPVLVKAIQQQEVIIQQQEARIAGLEQRPMISSMFSGGVNVTVAIGAIGALVFAIIRRRKERGQLT